MIPGVETYHARGVWEAYTKGPSYTVAAQNPPKQVIGNIWRPVAHYTAAVNLPDGDLGEHQYQIPQYLANIQNYYVDTRNYAIGYLFAVDWLGGVWELRGFDYKSAANNGHNDYTAPILMLVDGDDPVTPEAARSARAVWREIRRRSGRADFEPRPFGHGQLKAVTDIGTVTPCPGPGVQNQINSGYLDLDYHEGITVTTFHEDNRRLLDTRALGGRAASGQLLEVRAPDGAGMVTVNLTVTQPIGPGHLEAWGGQRGKTSKLNYNTGWTIANEVMVPVGPDGKFRVLVYTEAHVIIDLVGYWT